MTPQYHDQTDDPSEILADYQKRFPNKEFIFQVPYVGQFDVHFTIWGRDKLPELRGRPA